MTIENPLDHAADLAQNAGNAAAGLLGGTARFLEQVTGDAFTAAVFAAMLLFTLSLIRGASGARNPKLYIYSIIAIGGMIITTAFLLILYNTIEQHSIEHIQYIENSYIHKGFGLHFDETEPTIFHIFGSTFNKLKWYVLIGTVMTSVGSIMAAITPKSANKSAS
jgi:hypothetical protein